MWRPLFPVLIFFRFYVFILAPIAIWASFGNVFGIGKSTPIHIWTAILFQGPLLIRCFLCCRWRTHGILHSLSWSQRSPAKQAAWIFGHRPKRQKRTAVLFALNLPPGAKYPVFRARISFFIPSLAKNQPKFKTGKIVSILTIKIRYRRHRICFMILNDLLSTLI